MPAQPLPPRRLTRGSAAPAAAVPGGPAVATAVPLVGDSPDPDVPGSGATGDADPAFRHAYTRDRAQLLRRLRRIEGQVRGIARMVEREEYCVDILQQTSALRAAVDAVAVLILEDHVQGCVRTAAERGEADRYVEEVLDVVRRTLGRPIRGTRG